MKISFNAVIIVEFDDNINYHPGPKDIQNLLMKKGIMTSRPAQSGDPMILEFNLEKVKK